MKPNTIKWHLARDNRMALHRFCAKNKVEQITGNKYKVDGIEYFTIKYIFSNGGHILVELLAGTDSISYSVADHFQVADYSFGRGGLDQPIIRN